MYIYKRNPDPRIKPPLGSVLNPDHPLSQGLVGCWLLNEGGGEKVYNLTHYSSPAAITGSPWYWDANGWAHNGGYIYLTADTKGFNVHTFTLFQIIVPIEVDTGNGFAFKHRDGTTDSRIYAGTVNNDLFWAAGTITGRTVSIGWSIGDKIDLAVILNTGNGRFFYNGQQKDSATYTDFGNVASSIMFAGSDLNADYRSSMCTSLVYNRTLTNAEIAWLHAEPYANILAPQYWYMVDFGAAVTTGRMSRYHSLNGLGGQGQQSWNPLE